MCRDELINWLAENSNAMHYFDLQTFDCEVPIVKFNILQAYGSVLILIDKLKQGLKYKIFYSEIFTKNQKEVVLEKDYHVLNLTPNSTYEIFIASKRRDEEIFKFNSSSKIIKTIAFKEFIKITSNETNTNSMEIQWENSNQMENAFYLIHIDRNQSAEKIRKGWTRE